jgi:hypothetical protein
MSTFLIWVAVSINLIPYMLSLGNLEFEYTRDNDERYCVDHIS